MFNWIDLISVVTGYSNASVSFGTDSFLSFYNFCFFLCFFFLFLRAFEDDVAYYSIYLLIIFFIVDANIWLSR